MGIVGGLEEGEGSGIVYDLPIVEVWCANPLVA